MTRQNSILKLSSFLDKHYISPKKMSRNSIFLFLVPTETPFETILVSAGPTMGRFIVYDPQRGRNSSAFKDKINVLRPFIADYFDNFSDFESDADQVIDWEVQDGICSQQDETELVRVGSGIFIAKYLDLITQMKSP